MDLLDKILNLVSVIVGVLLTYWVTNKTNKNEYKREEMLNFNRDRKFLEARKRVYLDKRSRQLLFNYEDSLNKFQNNLKDNVNNISNIIRQELEEVLIRFSIQHFINYKVSFEKDSEEKKKMLS